MFARAMGARLDRRFSIAPMMDWTDRHCRFLHRLITRRALLYTEMAVDQAVIRGDAERLLAFDPAEQPVALQLGGSDPADLAEAARIGAEFGYAEINLNVGCPSDRVQSGRFGACLMREPDLVADCVAAMRETVTVPVTVKCRIGVDDQDPRQALFGFVETVAAAGADVFIVHARKAWLQGLSPKENRTVPPLDYDLVRDLKRARPDLAIILNGGLQSLADCAREGAGLDGVMVGRAAYQTPWMLAEVDRALFGENGPRSRAEVARAYRAHVAARLEEGVPLRAMTRHLLGLYHGEPGAREFRRILTLEPGRPGAGAEVIDRALAAVDPRAAAA